MTDITRVFDYHTRAIRNVERKYSGQIFDANATTIHFEYDPINFLVHSDDEEYWVPYIMFSVQDEDGNFLVYGPDPNTSQPTFDGYTFTIPWDVTSRVAKTRRVDYQLWFVKNTVDFDPNEGVAHLASTQYVLSEIDCIVIKPSIECRKKSPICPATAPSSEPSVVGYINLWKDYGIVAPVRQNIDPTTGKPTLYFNTYSGAQNTKIVFNVPPLVEYTEPGTETVKEVVPIEYIKTGHTDGTIPLIKGEIKNGRTLVYSNVLKGFVDGAAIVPEGSVTSAQLDEMASAPDEYGLVPGIIYNCTEDRVFEGDTYKAGTNWIWDVITDPDTGAVLEQRWEPLTAGEDLSIYQLHSFRTGSWHIDPTVDTDEYYPNETLVKTSIDRVDAKADANADAIEEVSQDLVREIQNISDRFDIDEQSISDIRADNTRQDTVLSDHDSRISTNASNITNMRQRVVNLETAMPTKLDRTDVINDASAATTTNTFSSSAELALLDTKTDKTQAIPVWDENETYGVNATVLYTDSIFVSLVDGNTDDPLSSDNWEQIVGGGGSGGGSGSRIRHKSIQFGNDTDTVYPLSHNLGTYDFLYSIRTTDENRQYVYADVYASSVTHLTVKLTEPPGLNALKINIMELGGTLPGETSVKDEVISEASTTWNYTNDTGAPVFIQAYRWDTTLGMYDQIVGSVNQTVPGFSPVTVGFNTPQSGVLLIGSSNIDREHQPYSGGTWVINHNLAQYVGVQCYDSQGGLIEGDMSQDGNNVVIKYTEDKTGYAVLMETQKVQILSFEDTSTNHTVENGVHKVHIGHNLDRFVIVQCYDDAWDRVDLDVQQNGQDSVDVCWNEQDHPAFVGRALII